MPVKKGLLKKTVGLVKAIDNISLDIEKLCDSLEGINTGDRYGDDIVRLKMALRKIPETLVSIEGD